MDPLESAHIDCPYCGESLEITVDSSVGQHEYVEDCQVCCKPIQFRIRVSAEGTSSIDVRSEDD
ncbi:MAG: CPXCG motif-containing cysteine-rich protein [Candidatus Omnitrophota bacterium]|nr:CPXCG motif-containing cysteine-rich protein [Candidatus Omnitrophota bacterium]